MIAPLFTSLLFGFTLPLRALGLILRSPRLLALSAAPVLLVLALDFFLITRLETAARLQISQWLAAHGFAPDGWLGMLTLALTWITLLLVSVLTFNFVANFAALPFNDFLAEATETRGPWPMIPVRATGFWGRLRIMRIDAFKSLLTLVILGFTLVLSWVPLLNFVSLLSAFGLMSFQYLSYPQTRRGEGVSQGIAFLWRYKFACTGFGAICSLGFAVPFVSAFFLPLAVVGGTLLYARAQSLDLY